MSISVVIPTYNTPPKLLERAIDSAIVAQADEIIVVDDGSRVPVGQSRIDDGVLVIRCDRNGGFSQAVNTGVEFASGDFVALLPADDAMHPARLRVQGLLMAKHNVGACFGGWLDESTGAVHVELHLQSSPLDMFYVLKSDNRFYGGTLMIWRELYREIGGCDETLRHACDWDLHLRIAQATDVAYYDGVCVTKGGHDKSLSATVSSSELNAERVTVRRRWWNAKRRVLR